MIYLFTSSQAAARGLRTRFYLKRTGEELPFSVFAGEMAKEGSGSGKGTPFMLAVYRGGAILGAAAVGSVCAAFGAGEKDALVYLGRLPDEAWESEDAEKSLFLCHKITEISSNRDFYPDILYRHGLPERTTRDEEAAAVYQAGSCFFGPHQMIFLEALEGSGTGEAWLGQAAAFLEELTEFFSKEDKIPFYTEEKEWTDRLCEALCCSQTMRLSVLRLIRYDESAGIDYKAIVDKLFREGKLPCKDKREGKLRLEELKGELL